MSDSVTPKWKLDVTDDSESCFYEEKGMHKKEASSLSMYDDPTGIFTPEDDRVTFCTFVIEGNQITHLVQWSVQNLADSLAEIDNYQRAYAVAATPLEANTPLPLWAVRIIDEHYQSKDAEVPGEIASQERVQEAREATAEKLDAEAREYFLAPPANWVTILKFPDLFLSPDVATEARVGSSKESDDSGSIVAQPREDTPLLPREIPQRNMSAVGGCLQFIKRMCCCLDKTSHPDVTNPEPNQPSHTSSDQHITTRRHPGE